MLKLVLKDDEFELVSKINEGSLDINNLNIYEQEQLQSVMVNNAHVHNEIFDLSKKALTPIVEVYQLDTLFPYWLDESTRFESDVWIIKLEKKSKTLDFNVRLDDGLKLTSKKHAPLLKSFKYWIISQGNPMVNGGKVLTPKKTLSNINKVLLFIDFLLINSTALKLSKRHLGVLSENVILDLLVRIASGGREQGVYDFGHVVGSYLKEHLGSVTSEEVQQLKEQYPYLNSKGRLLLDSTLGFDSADLDKACCYLYKQGAYTSGGSILSHPNSAYFRKLYPNTISIRSHNFSKLEELAIKDTLKLTEFQAVPVRNCDTDNLSQSAIRSYLAIIRSIIMVNKFTDAAPVHSKDFKNITLARINQHIEIQSAGRYRTLPASVVFSSIRSAFEFTLSYADEILEGAFNCIANKPSKKRWRGTIISTEFKAEGYKELLPQGLLDLGIEFWSINDNDPLRFVKRRQNQGFVDMFNVLMGSIQVIVGATMARRQGELLDLCPTNCLLPSDIDPAQNRDMEFSLVFENRKSGVGGQYASREVLSRPILNSVAALIYKLQMFNSRLIDSGLCKYEELSLFNNLNPYYFSLGKVSAPTFNRHFDAFCDYFETSVIRLGQDEYLRYYLRQHQLRRFFAMVFFWSKSYQGMEALSYFLAHTDLEHLYHYVTEGVSGEVLSGVKARAILDSYESDLIKNIEKLEPILKKRFGAKAIRIQSLTEAVDNYEDEEDFSTSTPIDKLAQEAEAEMQILELLENQVIDLKPEFFTLVNNDGSETRDFTLVLHITDQ